MYNDTTLGRVAVYVWRDNSDFVFSNDNVLEVVLKPWNDA